MDQQTFNAMLKEHRRRMALRETASFRWTNPVWNNLKLNQAWAIGYTSHLFRQKKFNNIAEWELYYYESGQARLEKISRLPKEHQLLLLNFKESPFKPEYNCLKDLHRSINKYSGRTESELVDIATYFHEQICPIGSPMEITLDNCIDFVKIRIIDEISIGIERENNTIARLKTLFPSIVFKETEASFDSEYSVDYEAFVGNKLLFGIQVKSEKYQRAQSEMLLKTKDFNQRKQDDYTKKFGAEVINVYAKIDGYIPGNIVIEKIRSYITTKPAA